MPRIETLDLGVPGDARDHSLVFGCWVLRVRFCWRPVQDRRYLVWSSNSKSGVLQPRTYRVCS